MTLVAVRLVRGPLDGQVRTLEASEMELWFRAAEMKPTTPGEAAIYEGEVLPERKGVYAWDGFSVNPRRFFWMGWVDGSEGAQDQA